MGETTFTREVFSSAPDRVIVVRLTADGPAMLRLLVSLDSRQTFVVRPIADAGLLMTGSLAAGTLTKAEDHLTLSENLRARW